MQCAKACHDTIYPSFDLCMAMAKVEQDGLVPQTMIPYCSHCGGPMQIHMEFDSHFIADRASRQRFEQFLQNYHQQKLVVIELGIGWRNQLIKAPLMSLVEKEPNATYITINLGEVYIRDSIKAKAYGIDGFISEALAKINDERVG